jgi:hypothetical protein
MLKTSAAKRLALSARSAVASVDKSEAHEMLLLFS